MSENNLWKMNFLDGTLIYVVCIFVPKEEAEDVPEAVAFSDGDEWKKRQTSQSYQNYGASKRDDATVEKNQMWLLPQPTPFQPAPKLLKTQLDQLVRAPAPGTHTSLLRWKTDDTADKKAIRFALGIVFIRSQVWSQTYNHQSRSATFWFFFNIDLSTDFWRGSRFPLEAKSGYRAVSVFDWKMMGET